MSTLVKNCIVCDNELISTLDLGNQPLANCYTDTENTPTKEYPLHLFRCKECFHLQINCIVDPVELFKNYIYVSGTSTTGKEYLKSFASRVTNGNLPCKVLDIACNDGTQLDYFKSLGCETVGVDPAENLLNDTVAKGHQVHCSFFNENTVDLLLQSHSSFDIIVAQNVFAHVSYPLDFLRQCSRLMNSFTKLYIQTSQAKMIQNNQFDTIYHEHISFFNVNSIKVLCAKAGLFLNNATIENIHGDSYLFEISKNDHANNIHDDSELYNDSVYIKYTLECESVKTKLRNTIIHYKTQGYDIIGYGSTAKSNTVLNYCDIDSSMIKYIIDENKLKQGKFAPGSRIPIIPLDKQYINDHDKTVIFVLAWNYFSEIQDKIKETIGDVTIINIQLSM